jgi:hypothetical protein
MKKIKKKVWALFYRIKNAISPSKGPANTVFVWIPKNAGTSVFDSLRRGAGFVRLKRIREVKKTFKQQGRVSFVHISYQKLMENGFVSKEFDESAYKFCFVRDPYERAVSLYRYFIKDNRIAEDMTFLDFCRLLNGSIDHIGLYNYMGFSQCNPQVRWTENLNFDFIGRQENLGVDYQTLAAVFGIDNLAMPHLNKTEGNEYEKYYCQETKRIVEEFYCEDFREYDYPIRAMEFDGE